LDLFPISERAGKVAYKLQLPEGVESHLVFHVSLLKKSMEPNAIVNPDLPPMDEENVYLIKWKTTSIHY